MKRHDSIKFIYNRLVLNDFLVTLAEDDEITEEELREQLRKMQEEQERLEREQEELMEEPEELPEEVPEEPEAEPEEPPTAEEPEAEPEEEEKEIPEEEKVEMPSQLELEKGQLEWVGTEVGMGMLKKYSPGAVLAKTCPVCTFQNRPIYIDECENCDKVFKRLKKFIAMKKRQNKQYTPEMAFEELAPRYKYIGPQAMREIFETKGKTKITEVGEIRSTPRKHLDDMLWYRLNVKKDPKTNEPVLDKRGRPIPLETKKYFSTAEMTEALHISPETLRTMVSDYNTNIIKNLPEEAQKLVQRDEAGDILPSSARQLSQYGFVAPTVIMGTGMADVRRRLTHEQEEKLSPEQIEGIKGPAFKSVDIAAWNWDKLKPVFGWDEEAGEFTHGWMKFLREKFLPAIRRDSVERKMGALQRVIDMYERIAASQLEDVKELWHSDKNKGLRVHTHFHYNPELTIEDFKQEWQEDYEEYMKEHKKVVKKRKVDKTLAEKNPKALHALENYDKREEPLTYEARQALAEGLAEELGTTPEKMEDHLDLRDEANEILSERPKEVEYMMFLEANPDVTLKSLKKKYKRRREAFEKNIWTKKNEAAEQFKARAERLKEKLEELEFELEEAVLPADFDLATEVRNYYSNQAEEATPRDPDPEVDKDLQKAEADIDKEKPKIQPPSPEEVSEETPAEKKSHRLNYITRLAVGGQLGLFGPEEEKEEEEEPEEEKPAPGYRDPWIRDPDPAFSREPNTKYQKAVTWLNTASNEIENSKGEFLFQGTKSLEEELTDEIGKYGYHNFGVLPGDEIFVTLTDPAGLQKVYKFMLDESGSGPVIYMGTVGQVGELVPVPDEPEPSDEEDLPEPEVGQEEKAEEAPAEDFGKVKGKYFVFFEWNPDYPGQPNSYKAFFAHTPGRRSIDFEELLKSKIEKRFGPKINPLMRVDPEMKAKRPDRTFKKYLHITVIEPTTERRRRFGAVINRETGELNWLGTGGTVERKEKERRLNLEKYKSLKKEVNLGVTKTEDIELVGDDDLKLKEDDVFKTVSPKKPKPAPKPVTDEERKQRLEKERKRQLRERVTPQTEMEEDEDVFKPPKREFKEPSGKPDPSVPVRKIVTKHGFIRKKIEKPVIDPATGLPKRDAQGKIVKKEKVVKIPKVDSHLITLRLNSEGTPVNARCERIGLSYKPTGETYERRAYPEIFEAVRAIIDRKKPELRKEKRWDERKDLMEKQYEIMVKKFHGEDASPFEKARKKEPYLTEDATEMNTKPCEKTPTASIPFDGACPEILAAVNSVLGKPDPADFEVRDWETIKRKPGRETSKELQERRRRHDVTDFFADDKTASRLERIMKLALL